MDSIKKWKMDLLTLIEFSDNTHHPDHPICPSCNWPMSFNCRDKYGELPYGEGSWSCPQCGFKIYEYELYTRSSPICMTHICQEQ